MSNIPKSQITFTVDAKVYTGLSRMAKSLNVAAGRMALMLFEAAYSTRHKPTGDADLDAAVARMAAPVATSQGDDALRKELRELAAKIEAATVREKTLQLKIDELKSQLSEPAPVPQPLPPLPASNARLRELEQAFDAGVAEVARLHADIGSMNSSIDERDAQIEKLRQIIDDLGKENIELKNRPEPPAPPAINELVTAIVLAWATGLDTNAIAKKTHLSEAMIVRTLNAWAAETQKKVAA